MTTIYRNLPEFTRICLNMEDIATLHGISTKSAYKIIKDIKKEQNIPKNKPLTLIHYCQYMNCSLDELKEMIAIKI